MTKEECADTEWQEVGLRDGRSGTPRSQEYQHYLNQCSKLSASLDGEKSAYARGLEEGFVVYCHTLNAEQVGLLGNAFHEEYCQPGDRSALMHAYRKGLARAKTSVKSRVN
jgi:hypothetical protein